MQPYQWLTRCDEDVGRCQCILMLFLVYPVEPTGYVVNLKYCRKRDQCGDDVVYVKLESSRSHRAHIISFSRGTSIGVTLASRTRESDI